MFINFKSPITKDSLKMMLSRGKNNYFQDIIFTFMGRDAIALSIEALDLTNKDKILLPAYLCPEILHPFIKKTQVKFYDINPDMTIDAHVVEKKIIEYNIKALFVIHYFGFIQKNIADIKQICIKHNVQLIEDCAQSILSSGCAISGDIVIYSLRKLLPLLDGGGLKVNFKKKDLKFKNYPQLFSDCLALLILIKSVFRIEEPFFSRTHIASMGGCFIKNKQRMQKVLKMSNFSKNILSNLDLEDIIEKRRNNFFLWRQLLEGSEWSPIFHDIPEGVCPFGFPIRVASRDSLLRQMRKHEVVLKVHWPLPQEVTEEFTNARDLSSHIVTLPVYPEIDEGKIRYVYKLMTSVIGGAICLK